MLHILGMILKIAGILLGSILGMVLLLLLFVLFVPIRYRVEGKYEEQPFFKAKISWFLSALSVHIRYEGEGVAVKVKLLGISLKKKEKAPQKPEAAETVQEQKPTKAARAKETVAEQQSDTQLQEEQQKEPQLTKKPPLIRRMAEKIRAWKEKIKCTIQNICDKIKEIVRKKEALQAFIKDEKNREAFRLVKRELLRLWRQIRPRRLSVSCHFGFDDPSVTGQVLAAGAVFYPLYRNNIRLYPDFTQKVLSGEGYLRGRIRIFPVLLIIIRLWKNKQIRTIVGKFMK